MTDRETLFLYRLNQGEETLLDAERMLQGSFSPRSITNRAYYAMFYAVLALFLKADITLKTSKHTGVISFFDKEFIQTGKIDRHYSYLLHRMFTARQKSDYKDLVETTVEEATEHVKLAREFLDKMKEIVKNESFE